MKYAKLCLIKNNNLRSVHYRINFNLNTPKFHEITKKMTKTPT